MLIGYHEDAPADFALFFHNFSTFPGKPGSHLHGLYAKPEFRGRRLYTKTRGTKRIGAAKSPGPVFRPCRYLTLLVVEWGSGV